ncbi:MAG: PP0621 family protein [Deltaproteobacteria bacterium]|nr:PP0621 family protein [Deltaproteobacteria bacterium]
MILKFLILGLLVYLFMVLLYSSLKRKGGNTDPSQGESMVLDPHCKSYVPKNEAYRSGGHYFCSEECARAYAAQQV